MAPALKRARTLNEKGEVQAKGLEGLSSDLRDMLNKPENSDVTIQCKDGICVHGCTWLLSIRCNVLKGLLSSRTPRSKRTKISLEKFSSSALLSVFEYLYTGTVEAHVPLDWKMGFEIMAAAKFFVIPELEIIGRDFVRNQMLNQVMGLEKHVAMEMLSIVLEFEGTSEEKTELVRKLVLHIGDDWLQENDLSWNLSEKAVDYLLSNRKRSHNGSEALSLDEYVVLRWIVLWQMHQKVPNSSQVIEGKPNVLPTGKDIPSLWRCVFKPPIGSDEVLQDKSSNPSESHAEPVSTVAHALAKHENWRASLRRLLRHIDLSLIPAFVLVKVVEPLHVVPTEDLLKALSFHALRSRTEFAMPKWEWRHSKFLTSGADREISCTSEQRDKGGVAVAFLPMLRSHGVYQWHFLVREKDADFVSFGFITGIDNHPMLQDDLDKNILVQNFARTIWYISCSDEETHVRREEGKLDFTWEPSPVKLEAYGSVYFSLDMSERSCRVWFSSFSATWTDLPSAVYYPVVRFSRCRRASIVARFGNGFDYLSLP